MINRNIKAIALSVSLLSAILLPGSSAALAQSGAASLRGWVAFENVVYVDKQPRAKVVLQHDPPGSGPAYLTETDAHARIFKALATLDAARKQKHDASPANHQK